MNKEDYTKGDAKQFGKRITSILLDEEKYQWVKDNNINLSKLTNKTIQNLMDDDETKEENAKNENTILQP